MATQAGNISIISAPSFVIQADQIPPLSFSELKGIVSEMESNEYIYNDARGNTYHSKQFGKMKPPTVTLVRGLDLDAKPLFIWHEAALAGQAKDAFCDVTLTISDSGGQIKLTYILADAWCTKLEVGNAKAGSNDNIPLTVTIQCSDISAAKT